MALSMRALASPAALPQLFPRLALFSRSSQSPASQWLRSVPSALLSVPAITLGIPAILSDIWESVLRAVPKKKTSHMKKRHRQLAGKALKDRLSVNNCPSCGEPKRAHMLCPNCLSEIRNDWKKADKAAAETTAASKSS
ncbi:hypothetical protein FQN55_004931 [Onygenales sp. PD_40]|nr:hypothetical protein FQN55_004931 [Onygenales sp. PD_40]KAK2758942.1 hypothetical protein FQN53_008161 [Emmonsiellopsis sp. PD_33]KAK2790901.1 hypothetical protein FQN52_005346 [Onygenales sp. PD_12]KAK2796349.1 hypothetical protein FQN51_009439 [Onygenales sp. PD_10]